MVCNLLKSVYAFLLKLTANYYPKKWVCSGIPLLAKYYPISYYYSNIKGGVIHEIIPGRA